jgi:CBS domain containing-hemolysin-like protein
MQTFKELRTLSAATMLDIQCPEDVVTLDLQSPATAVLTDFTLQSPLMLEQSTSIDTAREMMRRTHVKLKLVIDSHEHFRGVITLEDLMSTKVMRGVDQSGLGRHELTVAQVMTPRSELHGIDIRDLNNASIGDVLATMKKYGEQHVLVVDSSKGSIRGIISANDIARRLHVPIVISERANSFSDIYRAVAG